MFLLGHILSVVMSENHFICTRVKLGFKVEGDQTALLHLHQKTDVPCQGLHFKDKYPRRSNNTQKYSKMFPLRFIAEVLAGVHFDILPESQTYSRVFITEKKSCTHSIDFPPTQS